MTVSKVIPKLAPELVQGLVPGSVQPAHSDRATSDRRLTVTAVSLAREIWGSEVSLLQLVPDLAEEGIDLRVVAPVDSSLLTAARSAGAAVHPLVLPAHRGVVETGRATTAARIGREVPKVLWAARSIAEASRGTHVIHSNSLLANMDCALAGRWARRATVVEIHDLVRPGLSRQLLSTTVRLASAGVAISSPVRANLESWAQRRVRLIPQGVDVTRFRPGRPDPAIRRSLSRRPDEPLVAMVTRVDPEKNVSLVVRAMRALLDSGRCVTLVVLGAPSSGYHDYARQVERDAKSALGERVVFAGRRSDIAAALRSVDVLVSASDNEPFGLSVLEAQASGVPVVCAAAGGLLDFVRDGETGTLFRPGDEDQLRDALLRLLDRPETTARMAKVAVEQARTAYALPVRARAMAALYRSVVRSAA